MRGTPRSHPTVRIRPIGDRRIASLLHDRNTREVGRFMTGNPLDVASDARPLFLERTLSCEHVIDGMTKVGACHRFAVAGTTRIKLSAVNEVMPGIKYEKVGSASRFVSQCHFLSRIV